MLTRLEELVNRLHEMVAVERLREKTGHAILQEIDDIRTTAGHHDHRQSRQMAAKAGMHVVTVRALQVVIENDHLGHEPLDRTEDILCIGKRLDDDAPIAKQIGECARNKRVVVDQQDANLIRLAQRLPSPFAEER
jgi:hypothetical protein